jgi:alkylation response protein AidB-like acyl-CoA dehydrogenase
MKNEYLPKLISGEWISAIAMTEPGGWVRGEREA